MVSFKIWQIIFLIPLAMLFTWIWFPIFGYNNALYTFYCSLGVAAAALFLAFGNYFFQIEFLKPVPRGTLGSIWSESESVLYFQLQHELRWTTSNNSSRFRPRPHRVLKLS